MVETFDSWVRELGSLGYLVLALAALIEYLAPPFPGDTIVLMGGAYAVRGGHSVAVVLLGISVASFFGICANYAVGRYVAGRVSPDSQGHLLFGVTHAHIRDLQHKMRERGAWLLVANRFLPTFRTVLFIAAGASRMPLRKVLVLGMTSAVVWNAMLLGAGVLLGGNADRLEKLVSDYKRAAFLVFAVVVVVLVAKWWRGRRRAEA